MSSKVTHTQSFSLEQLAFTLLLLVGLYYPTSTNGEEHSVPAILITFTILAGLLACLVWKLGIRREVAIFISLPIIIVLTGCTFLAFLRGPLDFDAGLFTRFSVLALILALDIRTFRPGSLLNAAFVLVNFVNIACGFAILAGIETVTGFISTYYWISDAHLVPLMMTLHKPVLTFGSHSLAGLFVYLFFWINWENFTLHRRKLSLCFALCYFILLLGLTSFTSLGFAALALTQITLWSWKRNAGRVVITAFCVVALLPFAAQVFADEIEVFRELPEIADSTFLNSDQSGPLSRYQPGGSLRPAITYLLDHPFSPIGVARSLSAFDVPSPSHFFVGDSGPLVYVLRGSLPFIFLVYFGLYRFLRNNLELRGHATALFLVILAFETGYSALDFPRTYFLLPFFVVFLNQIASPGAGPALQSMNT
jgi:hypothetical protein